MPLALELDSFFFWFWNEEFKPILILVTLNVNILNLCKSAEILNLRYATPQFQLTTCNAYNSLIVGFWIPRRVTNNYINCLLGRGTDMGYSFYYNHLKIFGSFIINAAAADVYVLS